MISKKFKKKLVETYGYKNVKVTSRRGGCGYYGVSAIIWVQEDSLTHEQRMEIYQKVQNIFEEIQKELDETIWSLSLKIRDKHGRLFPVR